MKMYFSRMVLMCSLIVASNLPSVYLDTYTTKDEGEVYFLGEYLIEEPMNTPDPINIESENAEEVDLKPLTLEIVLNDKVEVKNIDGKTVALLLNQTTAGTSVTGGVFENDKYKFNQIEYFWTDDINKAAATTINENGYPLEVRMIFVNEKYHTFEDALPHRDGLAAVDVPISICSNSNDLFKKYAAVLEKVKQPNTASRTRLGVATKWYDSKFPTNGSYFAYPGSYTQETTKKVYSSATVIILPNNSNMCISKEQFEQTFGAFKNSDGEPLTNQKDQSPTTMPIVQAKGIQINKMP